MNGKDKLSGVPTILFNNKYEQVRLLGEGSFGKAFLVESIEDKTLAVIKAIDLGSMSEEEKIEAIQEGKILEKLDHPNIIKFKEVYIEDKSNKHILSIVMDFADGGDLQQRIRGQKGKYFSETLILDWFTQMCLAIKHIHDRKILHRDVKSQNIFLTKNGLVKLGDFGIAKCLNKTLDKAKTIVGTPYYLSPEIVQNRPYSFKSDIWSLGVLLYEMCALKMPFDAQNLPLLSLKIIRCSYNPLPPNFSKELRSLVNIMLSVDTNKRFSINEVLRQPIIKSRIKNFLNEIEFNKEFSHTILHNFKIFKNNKSDFPEFGNAREGKELKETRETKETKEIKETKETKERENSSGNVKNEYDRKDYNNRDVKDVKEMKDGNYQKPIIKKESGNNINNNKKKNYHNNELNVFKDKEKEIETNVSILKKNLSNGVISSNNNNKDGRDNREINTNPNSNCNSKQGNGVIPSFAFNYDREMINKPKVRGSIEIESNRTPKIEKVMPDSSKSSLDKRSSDKKSEIASNNVYENLKRNNINKKKDLIMNNINSSSNVVVKDVLSSKKSVESIVQSSLSTNPDNITTERKRSESRGSAQEEKEKHLQLKDFMQNMKENMKKEPQMGENNVIWMKGMKDFIDKEREKEINIGISNGNCNGSNKKEHDTKSYMININNNLNVNLLTNNSIFLKNNEINYNFKNKNSKDLKDYIETQKMLIELEKLQNEEFVEEDNLFESEVNYEGHDILNEFKDLNEFDMECNTENLLQGKDINDIYFSSPVSTDIDSYQCSDLSIENSLKIELDQELGKELFLKVYRILTDNLNTNIVFFDLEALNSKIKQECSAYEEMNVDMAIARVPDVYCLVIKDRERKN